MHRQRAKGATFFEATEGETARPMLDICWAPMLGALSVLFEEFPEGTHLIYPITFQMPRQTDLKAVKVQIKCSHALCTLQNMHVSCSRVESLKGFLGFLLQPTPEGLRTLRCGFSM